MDVLEQLTDFRVWEGEAPAEPIALMRLGRSLAFPNRVRGTGTSASILHMPFVDM